MQISAETYQWESDNGGNLWDNGSIYWTILLR